MNTQKRRRKWSPADKLRIVLEALQSDGKLSGLCRREGLSPNRVYQWRKQLLGSADAVFTPKRKTGQDPKIEKLEVESLRMKNVIAEITAENLDLKKNALGLSDHAPLPPELQREVMTLIEQTQQRSRWPARRTLKALAIPPAGYYRWRQAARWKQPGWRPPTGSMYELLASERRAILDYALRHPEVLSPRTGLADAG